MQNKISNKHIVIFIGLKHHYKKLAHLIFALKNLNARVSLLTTRNVSSRRKGNRECFERFLIQENIQYKHLYDYRNECTIRLKKIQETQTISIINDFIDEYDLFPFDQFEPDELETAIFDAVESKILFSKMFDIEKPDMVLALHEVNFWAKLLFQEANRRNIFSLSLQEGLYDDKERRVQKYAFMANYSNVAVWGNNARKILLDFNCLSENIHITGNPEYDLIYKNIFTKKNVNTRKRHKKKMLIMLPNPYLSYEKAIPLEMIGEYFKNNKTVDLYIKWHPRESASFINRAGELYNKYNMISYFNENISSLLPDMDLCMVLDSSAGLDALLNNIPLVELNCTNINFGRSYSEKNVALSIRKLEELNVVFEILDCGKKTFNNEALKTFLYDNFFKPDGNALSRILKVIENNI